MSARATIDTGTRDVRAELVESARDAGLKYGTEEDAGYRRKPWGGGFTYICEDGSHLKDDAERERIESLAIPPDWTDVWIAADPNRHIQATGRDSAGRKQYIYHPRWEEVRKRVKFDHLLEFGRCLPEVRRRADRDMRARSLCRTRVLGLIVELLDRTLFRAGHEEYVRRHGHYGLTTLRKEHVEVTSSSVTFEFVGKSDIEQSVKIVDRRIARQVGRLFDLPGERLFRFDDGDGEPKNITPKAVNAYLRETVAEACSTKDFRTWGATRTFVEHLLEREPPADADECKKFVDEAVAQTADDLKHTERVCRQHYLHPSIVAACESGELWQVWEALDAPDEPYFSPVERLVLELG